MKYKDYPKTELHLHLDCSLSYDVIKKIRPGTTRQEYDQKYVAPGKCTDLAEYIRVVNNSVELMQSKENLRLVTFDLVDQLKKENVIYAEIRFAPILHIDEGLTPEEVVETVNEALDEAVNDSETEAGLILCTLRHFSREQSMQTIKLVESFIGKSRVLGFDIAADEAGFTLDNHIEAFEYALAKGIPCTAHAGEAKGAESVWETLNHLKPQRIGHGVRSIEDADLVQHLSEQEIHLEVCVTSNLYTNMYESYEKHPINELYKSGVSLSVNTDGRGVNETDLTNEYQKITETFSWDDLHFLTCNLEAIRHAFIPDQKKQELKKKLLAFPAFKKLGELEVVRERMSV